MKLGSEFEQQRELALYQLRGIGTYLDVKGIPRSSHRNGAVVAMAQLVRQGIDRGVVYDGGDWQGFMDRMKGVLA